MLESESLVDVTMAAEGQQIKAHKVVLSVCSPYFHALFASNPCKHPIVILKDVRFQDLKSLVEFMYRGEVTVGHDQLPSLLKTAETLQIKQLAEMTSRPAYDNVQQPQTSRAGRKRKRPKNQRQRNDGTETGESDGEGIGLPGKHQLVATGYATADGTGLEAAADGQVITSEANHGEGASRILELSMAEVVGGEATEEITADPDNGHLHLEATEAEMDDGSGGTTTLMTLNVAPGQEDNAIMVFRKKQSFVWEYFSETGKGSVKCRKCAKLLSYKDTSGSTSNMIKHLKTVHSVERAFKPPLQE